MPAARFQFFRLFGHRLYGHVFVHGLILIAAVVAAVMFSFRHVGKEPELHNAVSRTAALVSRDLGDPAALERRLADVAFITGGSVAVFASDGRTLAAAGKDALEPLPAAGLEALRRERMTARPVVGLFAVALDGGRAEPFRYLLLDWGPAGAWRWFVALGVIVILIAGSSYPLSRAIARPLERLTGAARKLKGGDLSARAGFSGRGEVGVLADAFDDMAGELERRIRGEQELLANVSHEIRTPLSRIRVAIELCEEPDASLDDVRRRFAGLAADVTELELLVDEVLTAARLDLTAPGRKERGPLGQAAEPVEIAELARLSTERFAHLHPSRRLIVAVAPDLPRVEGAAALLRRAVDNLIENAVKYSPEGSEIELEASLEGGSVVVSVGDRGIGVAPEEMPFLFEPFFRGEGSRSRGTSGSGLGLALVRRIATAHGGSVSAESRQGGGMCFRFSLPADRRA
jgi:two-component system, OmpR family, sensor kinase